MSDESRISFKRVPGFGINDVLYALIAAVKKGLAEPLVVEISDMAAGDQCQQCKVRVSRDGIEVVELAVPSIDAVVTIRHEIVEYAGPRRLGQEVWLARPATVTPA